MDHETHKLSAPIDLRGAGNVVARNCNFFLSEDFDGDAFFIIQGDQDLTFVGCFFDFGGFDAMLAKDPTYEGLDIVIPMTPIGGASEQC